METIGNTMMCDVYGHSCMIHGKIKNQGVDNATRGDNSSNWGYAYNTLHGGARIHLEMNLPLHDEYNNCMG